MNSANQEIDVSIIRDFPIEDILQKLSVNVWASLEGEPRREHLDALEGLLDASERGLQAIVEGDAKCRPPEEWLRALNIVEGIRDECLEAIGLINSL